MEFIASYDFKIAYTPGKGNVVADALCGQRMTLSPLFVERKILELISTFGFRPSTEFMPGLLESLEVRPTLLDQIGTSQREDPHILDILDRLSRGETSILLSRYSIYDKGWLRRNRRLCVPQVGSLLKKILEEAHRSKMTIHPRGDKMYKDIKGVFVQAGMKKDMVEFVSQCLICQQVKAEQKKTGGLLHPLEVPQ